MTRKRPDPHPVLSVILRRYRPEVADQVEALAQEIGRAAARQPGFVDLQTSHAEHGGIRELITVFTFASEADLARWTDAPARRDLVAQIDAISESEPSQARFDELQLLQGRKAELSKIEVVAVLIFWIVVIAEVLTLLAGYVLPDRFTGFWREVLLISVNVLLISYIFLPWSSRALTRLKSRLRAR